MINPNGILYIEPSAKTSVDPVIDELTRKMTAAYRQSKPGPGYRGVHFCACNAASDNCEHELPNGIKTNSLCIHYLAHHRDEVPAVELEKVRLLDCGEAEPTDLELGKPWDSIPESAIYKIRE